MRTPAPTHTVCIAALFLWTGLLLAPPASAQIFVDQSATGDDDGSSWEDAYVHLQDAFDEANNNLDAEIRIAEGVYYPDEDQDGDHTEDDPAESFMLSNLGGVTDVEVEIRGGYPPGGGARNPEAHPTVLSGDITQDDATNASGVTERAADQNGTNSHHVLLLRAQALSNVTSATVVDGVIITGGQADGPEATDTFGGGLFCDADSNDGGRVCSPTISNVAFAGNSAEGEGGGLYNGGGFAANTANPTITNAIFVGNTAFAGGAIFNNAAVGGGMSSPTIVNAIFSGNSATDGGAIFNDGGGIGTSSPTITNCSFFGNSASSSGGAILNATDSDNAEAEAAITNNIFFGNTASTGDQIANFGPATQPTVSYTDIEDGISGISENDGSSTTDGGGNIDQDPQFADPDGPDGITGTLDDDLRLQGPGSVAGPSPAIDAGDNTAVSVGSDLGNNPRFIDVPGVPDTGNGTPPIVDMGAYESEGTPLPVEVASFEAIPAGSDAVALSWRTVSETGNAGFRIERKRTEAAQWSEVAFVESNAPGGTSSETIRYHFADGHLPAGIQRLSYRLVQIDLDGATSAVAELTVDLGAPKTVALKAPFPNPVREAATIRYALPEQRPVKLTVYDAMGRVVRTLVHAEQRGRKEATFHAEGLSSGLYFVRLTAGDIVKTRRMVVIR